MKLWGTSEAQGNWESAEAWETWESDEALGIWKCGEALSISWGSGKLGDRGSSGNLVIS